MNELDLYLYSEKELNQTRKNLIRQAQEANVDLPEYLKTMHDSGIESELLQAAVLSLYPTLGDK